jgi:hypothetical protein
MTYKADLHVHTAASLDGLSSLEELTAAAKEAGLDAVAITDHNLCTPVPQRLNGVLLIPGCEVSTRQGHVTGLFLEEPLDLEGLRKNGLPQGGDAVEEIHRRGGIAVLAHPYQSPGAAPEGFDFRPDCVEGANARAALKVKEANERAAALAQSLGLPAVGGSDAHSRREVGNAYTRVEGAGLTLSELKAAVLTGNCAPVLVKNTSHLSKGLSQFAQRRRKGGLKNLAVGAAYVLYCSWLDILRK